VHQSKQQESQVHWLPTAHLENLRNAIPLKTNQAVQLHYTVSFVHLQTKHAVAFSNQLSIVLMKTSLDRLQ
jgi:hypothetical protein